VSDQEVATALSVPSLPGGSALSAVRLCLERLDAEDRMIRGRSDEELQRHLSC
jgi:hypothetical protein